MFEPKAEDFMKLFEATKKGNEKKRTKDDCSCGEDCGVEEGTSGRKHRRRMRVREGDEGALQFKAMIGSKVYKTVVGQEDETPGYIVVHFDQFQNEVPDSDQLYLEDDKGMRYKRVMSSLPEDDMVLFRQL